MILWTIQDEGAWRRAETIGALRADDRYRDPLFAEAYAWMTRELRRRVGPPPRGVRSPVWAWLQYENASRPRPDLRRSGHLARGTRGVRIEFVADADRTLLSDFDLWHYVLNRCYVPQSSREADLHMRGDLTAGANEMKASWQRVLDVDWHLNDIAVPRAVKSIQAVVWEVPLASVRAVTPFIAR